MAKGIPLMGRGPDGKAKMINVDENGNVKVQQSGNIVKTTSITFTEPIMSDTNRIETIIVPAGKEWEIKSFSYISGDPPSGANGFHRLQISYGNCVVASGKCDHTKRLVISANSWFDYATDKPIDTGYPSNTSDTFRGLVLTNTVTLNCRYFNNLGKDTSNPRIIQLTYLERNI